MNYSAFLFLLCFFIYSCDTAKKSDENASENKTISITYAEGFKATTHEFGKLVEVLQPYPDAKTGFKYLLVERGKEIPPQPEDIKVIRIPISTIVCTSTTHIPLLDYLNVSESLIGFPTTDYISSAKTRLFIEQGKVTELGVDKGMNIELIASIAPDLVMGYTMSADIGQFKKIEELGIPVIINSEYLEKHPLGRAEWIKFLALFYNKEELADSVFRSIEGTYLETQQLALSASERPTVMSGIVYGDTWFLPGGNNYAAKLLQDAGGNYLWSDNESNGFLELSFESVYEKASSADLWIGVASFKSLSEMKNAEARYTKFKSFQTGKVYTYDARKGAKGGSEFLELGYLRPDIILKDLVKILHPNLLPDYELYFHKQLQ